VCICRNQCKQKKVLDLTEIVLFCYRTVLSNGSLLLDGRPEEGWYQCLVTCDSLGAIISRKARLQVACKCFDFSFEGKAFER